MLISVFDEPRAAAFQRFGLFLVGAGGVKDVVIVDVVDGDEVRLARETKTQCSHLKCPR
jgi:hypothetical protein